MMRALQLQFVMIMTYYVPFHHAFTPLPPSHRHSTAACFSATNDSKTSSPESMRVSDIRNELKELSINFSDCFDKESLVIRLQDAREGKVKPGQTKHESSLKEENSTSKNETTKQSESDDSSSTPTNFDTAEEELVAELSQGEIDEVRAMSGRSLRDELGRRRISWAGLFEKEDLIQAVLKARKLAKNFSASGKLTPGQVSDLSGSDVELEWTKAQLAPLLLDVYATWCGPCRIVAPEVQKVAEEYQDRLRVAKMDSDKHAEVSSKLQVQGLPTLVLFQNGKEIDRIEGALMKDQIVEWIESKI